MSLECKDLIKIYSSPVEGIQFPALRGLDLKVNKGELIAIIGPSGSGKTTLFRLISGYDHPSSGEIWYNNQLVNGFKAKELIEYRKTIGIMYQSPADNLIWDLSALDNVMLPLRNSGKFAPQQKDRALELIKAVGLRGKEQRRPTQLSGGEQQRIAIAVALANEPELLLADEPTGELDSQTTMEIIEFFKILNEERHTTIIVATHDKRFSKMTDKTFKIQDGRITTFHLPDSKVDKDKQSIRNEAIVVDSHGNIRLPKEILSQFRTLSAVKATVKDGQIVLTPFNA